MTLCLLQLTARRERVRKNQLGVFVGIMRGLRLDFRSANLELEFTCKWVWSRERCVMKCFLFIQDLDGGNGHRGQVLS